MLIALIGFVLAKSATEWAEEVDAACKGVGSEDRVKMASACAKDVPTDEAALATYNQCLVDSCSPSVLPKILIGVAVVACCGGAFFMYKKRQSSE